jgi:hypothetical protein
MLPATALPPINPLQLLSQLTSANTEQQHETVFMPLNKTSKTSSLNSPTTYNFSSKRNPRNPSQPPATATTIALLPL